MMKVRKSETTPLQLPSTIKNIDYNLLILIIIPIIFSVANEDWLFGVPSASDHWINYNFFQDFSNDLNIADRINPFPYKISRVSVFAVAYPLHQIFSPITAYYIYALMFFYMATIGLYMIIKNILNQHVAIIIAIILSCYKFFHTPISFELMYQNYPCLAYFMLAILFAVLATRKENYKLWLFLSGAFFAASLSQVLYVNFFPSLALLYYLLNRRYGQHALLPSFMWFTVGAIAMTFILSTISYFAQDVFCYFCPQIQQVLYWGEESRYLEITGGGGVYWISVQEAFKEQHLREIIAAAIVSLLAIVFFRKKKDENYMNSLALMGAYLLAFFIMLFWQAWGQILLSATYMTYNLIPMFFLSLAGIYSILIQDLWKDRSTHIIVVLFTLSAFISTQIFYDQARVIKATAKSYLGIESPQAPITDEVN